MTNLYDKYKEFMDARLQAKEQRGDRDHFASHCDSRILHLKSDCTFCGMSEFDDLHEYREQNKILHTGETPRSGWWPCPAEHERGLKSVNSWGGNTAKPAGCTCSWFEDLENPCPIHK